jgi:hypothetical protein
LLDNTNSKARNKICVKMLMKPHTCMVLIFVCFSRCPVTIVHKRMAWELRDETVPCGLTNQALPPSVRPGSNCGQAAGGTWVACRQDVGGHWYLECRLPTSSQSVICTLLIQKYLSEFATPNLNDYFYCFTKLIFYGWLWVLARLHVM